MACLETVPTPLGDIRIVTTALGVSAIRLPQDERPLRIPARDGQDGFARAHAVSAKAEMTAYIRGELVTFSTPVDLSNKTSFEREVLLILKQVPFGETVTYGSLADATGHPHAARAVGGVMRRNETPIVVPCHRVLAADRRLGGWTGPRGWKETLLAHEGFDGALPSLICRL